MDPHPSFLKQIICLLSVRGLAFEEPQQRGTYRDNQGTSRFRIGLLVALHPAIQFDMGLLHPHLSSIRNRDVGSYVLVKHFLELLGKIHARSRQPKKMLSNRLPRDRS
jgi:hypothetical protein